MSGTAILGTLGVDGAFAFGLAFGHAMSYLLFGLSILTFVFSIPAFVLTGPGGFVPFLIACLIFVFAVVLFFL